MCLLSCLVDEVLGTWAGEAKVQDNTIFMIIVVFLLTENLFWAEFRTSDICHAIPLAPCSSGIEP